MDNRGYKRSRYGELTTPTGRSHGSSSTPLETPIPTLKYAPFSGEMSALTEPHYHQITQSQTPIDESYSFEITTEVDGVDGDGDDEGDDGKDGDSDVEGSQAEDFLFELNDEDELERVHQQRIARFESQEQNSGLPYCFDKEGNTFKEALSFPKIPSDYKPKEPNKEKNEPDFEDVDNPGGWNNYIYTPRFEKEQAGGNYMYHRLPSGVTPVPPSENFGGPVREYKGWQFHYVAWNGDGTGKIPATPPSTTGVPPTLSRKYVEPKNLFPPERRGSLDREKLEKYGLTTARMQTGDALFFYQLLMPLHFAKMQEGPLQDDERMNYYNKVLDWTLVYHIRSLNGGYGRPVKQFSLQELLKFDGIIFLHGALGAKHHLKKRWDKDDCCYQKEIGQSGLSFRRWCEIKRNLKLCDNRVEEERAQILGINLASKFNHIYKCIIHNVRVFTKKACLDLVIDESTWAYYGFGPFIEYLIDKMVSRGGQTVLLMDADRLRPRGFLHRHKGYKKKDGFPSKGMSEVHDLIANNVLEYIGEDNMWSSEPHLTVDNYFNGDEILNWMGEKGLGMIGTVPRNRLPKGVDVNGKKASIEHKYFHKESTSGNPRARLARFANPITMVRDVAATETTKAYRRVHCSFQSTGPCNIGSVNSLPCNYGYISPRERGRGLNKRRWGIEMNHSRETYLNTWRFEAQQLLKYKKERKRP